MNLLAFSGLFIAIVSVILFFIMLVYGKTTLHKLWVVLNFFVVLWGLGLFIIATTSNLEAASVWWKLASASGGLLAPLLYNIVCLFTETKSKKLLTLFYLQIFVFVILDYSNLATYKLRYIFCNAPH